MSSEKLPAEKILGLSISDAVPHIFSKGTVFVAPSTALREIALFLIPLRELFVSGIVVMKENKPVGRIGPKHILEKVIEVGYQECLKLCAQDLMVGLPKIQILANFEIREVLEFFKDTKFGFCPIIRNDILAATVSTRDFLPLVSKMKLEQPVSTISSELIYTSSQISIENALRIILKKNIRKIAVKEKNTTKIVDDRSLLGYLFLWEFGKPNLVDTEIGVLPKSNVSELPSNTHISKVADELLIKDLPCHVYDDKIVTPWDLVMKTLGTFIVKTDVNDSVLLD